MRVLSLYSGVGGSDLAATWFGWEPVAFCEADAFCRQILALRHPGVPIYGSDEDITAERLAADGITDIDLVLGTPPCQPASQAGRRLGTTDLRWRWPEYLRIVREVRPRWIVAENPRGILSLGDGEAFAVIKGELEALGYRPFWPNWHAADVGAPHERDRVFIVGFLADSNRK